LAKKDKITKSSTEEEEKRETSKEDLKLELTHQLLQMQKKVPNKR